MSQDELTQDDIDEKPDVLEISEEHDDFENEEDVEDMLENDEISPAEAGFQEGVDRDL